MLALKRIPRFEFFTVGALLLLLVLTRSGLARSHFGTELNLPDASWAVFWLMGALTSRLYWPALSLAACVAIDYWVIAGGVSAYCFTPAYPFLIPAYLSLWVMGRWSRWPQRFDLRAVGLLATSVLVGVSLCFVIANIGFYLSSGYFAQLPAARYAGTVAQYWPTYLLHTAMYVFIIGLLHHMVMRRAEVPAPNSPTA